MSDLTPNESIRRMPHGVKRHLISRPSTALTPAMASWMLEHGLHRPAAKKRDSYVLTKKGENIKKQLVTRYGHIDNN